MGARKGQGSTLQVVAGIIIVSVLILVLFITQSTTSAETLEQSAQSSQVFRTNIYLGNTLATSYYLQNYDNLDMDVAISFWCKYGDNNILIGTTQQADSPAESLSPVEQIQVIPYLQRLLDRTVENNYRLEIDCNPKAEAFNKRTAALGEQLPSSDIYSAETVIPDQTNTNHRIQVLLYTWN